MEKPKTAGFEKQPQPDLKAFYSAEQVGTIPYMTLWEGTVEQNQCFFQTSQDVFKTADEIEGVRDALIELQTRGRTYRDDSKARLNSLEVRSDGGLKFTFSQVRYSDYIVTNNAMEIRPAG